MKPSAPPAAPVTVRAARADDIPAVAAIYDHHVRNGFASFEEVAPDRVEMSRRWQELSTAGFPYLVAEIDRLVGGFAYAGPYRPRSAYRFSVEDSVYVAPEAVGLGMGRQLMAELIRACTALGYRQMIAVIGDSGNTPSIWLHERMGFERMGLLRSAGFKKGQWVDVVFMQRALGLGDTREPGS